MRPTVEMTNDPDQVIIDQLLAGDQSVYAVLVDKYKRYAFTIAQKILQNRPEAEEAAQARRNLSMPGISATVAEQIEALRRAAGDQAVKLIRREPDPTIMKIVEGWPRNFDTKRALSLGFRADKTFDDIVRAHIEDELKK
jgi:nucleoside-diphosphate-sugar epimerase